MPQSRSVEERNPASAELARTAGRRHLLDLVAHVRLVIGLKDQPIAAERPVRLGVVAAGATADLAVLDRDLNVVQTYIAGTKVWDVVSGSPLSGPR